MMRMITAEAAKRRLHDGSELAFLDVRDPAAFGEGHPLFAIPCPYSQLELSAVALVPRRDCPIVLIGGGDGIAERAARRLAACGYTDIAAIEGGVPAWRAAGFGLFAGVNVPSKTLGEMLEHAHHPTMIEAATLACWQDEGRRHLFFDARPPAEYAKMRIRGASCLPNGELAHRLGAVLPDAETPVVITCAGRTRGIIGALGLKALGIPNPVLALENGTQGWALAGFPLDRGGVADALPELDPQARTLSRARARQLIASGRLSNVDAATAQSLLGEGGRTTFLFDLRSASEREARAVPGSVPALAGQLVQSTDQYVGVRHARLILLDDTGLRAALAALFLNALGFETHVLALDDEPDAAAPAVPPSGLRVPPLPAPLGAGEGIGFARDGVPVLDLRPSQEWERSRLASARWASRSTILGTLPAGARRVLLQGDAASVAAAALDLAEAGIACDWIAADLDACAAAGWLVDATPRRMTRDEALDRVWFVHDRHDGNADASRQYLAWEMGLIDQLDEAERASFGALPQGVFG
ncbi:rhodanese-like domain-containing protein [Ancylobacter sp. VNQ12]|uniref:rhodanese-like domain-containing protein n=1 Tax=Ancylobacter sp. VNQ12 TaxID=3400920 RepID=UPI003BFC6A94